MNSSIIFVLFYIFLNEVLTSNLQFSNLNSTKSIDIYCNDSNLNFVGEKSMVEIFVYQEQCVKNKSELKFISKDFNEFKNLKTINVSYLGIDNFLFKWETISDSKANREKIEDQLNITSFIATHNYFSTIQNYIFKYMPNIHEIDYSSNRILSIESKNFEFKSKLEVINCSNNSISELKNDVFSKLINLKILNLSENQINHIDVNVFSKLDNLETLNLNQNRIKHIDKNLFANNKRIKEVNLRNNLFKQFDFNIFSQEANLVDVQLPLYELEELDASCGQLKESKPICHFNGFDGEESFKHLVHFNASGNQMNVSKLLSRLGSNVEVLDLSRNFVNELKYGVMGNFTKLIYLNLSHTNISSIEADAFHYQVKLITLDLSYNALLELKSDVFPKKFTHLKTLNLESNPLATIDAITPEIFPNLENLGLSRNELYFDDMQRIENCRRLKKLNSTCISLKPSVEGTQNNTTHNSVIAKSNITLWEPILYAVLGTAFCIGLILSIIWLIRRRCVSKMAAPIEDSKHNNQQINRFKDIPSSFDSDYEDIELTRPTSFNPVPINYPQITTPYYAEIGPSASVLSTRPPAYHHYATVNKQMNV